MDKGKMEIKNLTISYKGSEDNPVFDNFSLSIKKKSITGILAPSGTGKTTLLSFFSSADINRVNASWEYNSFPAFVSCVFQEPRLLPWLTVIENVALPLCKYYGKNERLELASELLKENGLYQSKDKFPCEISGGEKGRVAVARAFSFLRFCTIKNQSPLLLLDEPFKSQDPEKKSWAFTGLRTLVEKNAVTTLFVTHSIEEVLAVSDRIIILKGRPARIAGDFDLLASELKSKTELENFIKNRFLEITANP